MDHENDIDALSRYILETSGVVDVNSSDCKRISEKIFNKTKQIISETTLKRLFGFAKRDTNFSRFTLDTLASYAGFANWSSFKSSSAEPTAASEFNWDKLKQRAMAITNYSLQTIKNGAGIPYSKTIQRSFIFKDYQQFLNSEKLFTVMVSPAGRGKSILLAQLTDYFFLGEQAIYPNDIPIVINGAIINNLVLQGADIEHWVKHEIGTAFGEGFGSYFKSHPHDHKGKIILFFDGLNFEELGIHYFNRVIDLLLYYNNVRFKVILSMGQSSWTYFKQIIIESSHLAQQWYKGLFFDHAESTNLPYFTKGEVAKVLGNLYDSPIEENGVDPYIYNLLKSPYWFHLFAQFLKSNKTISPKEHLVYYELIFKFANQKIFNTLKSAEKTHLLLQIISDPNYHIKSNYIEKRHLLTSLFHFQLEYKELLKTGILYEKPEIINKEVTEIVGLQSAELLPFLLCRKALLDANFFIDQSFFNKLLSHYNRDHELLIKILKWVVRHCITNNIPQHLSQILDMPFTRHVKNTLMEFAYAVINFELEKHDSDFAKKGVTAPLISFLINGKILCRQFGQTVKNLKDVATESEEIAILVDLLLCLIAIAHYQKDELKHILDRLEKSHKRIKRDLPIDVYEMAVGVYKQMTDADDVALHQAATKKAIIDFCDKAKLEQSQKDKKSFTLKEMLAYRIALNILFIRQDFEVCYELVTCIQHKHPNMLLSRNSNFVHLIKITMGSIYLRIDNVKMTKKIYAHLEVIMTSPNTYFAEHIAAVWLAFKAEYAVFFKDYKNGLILVNRALDIAEKNNLISLSIGLTILKLEVTRNLFEQEDFGETFDDLVKLLQTDDIDLDVLGKFANPKIKRLIETYRK